MDAAIVEQSGKLLPLVSSGSGEVRKPLPLLAPGAADSSKPKMLAAPNPGEAAEAPEPRPAQAAAPLEEDPLYMLAITGMQQGQWAVAAKALPELEARYPDSPEVRALQHLLALRLSAEETWSPRAKQPLSFVRTRLIPALLIGNAVLYSLLGVAWLVATLTHVSL